MRSLRHLQRLSKNLTKPIFKPTSPAPVGQKRRLKMRKIINGTRYDTEKAELLGTGTSGGSQSDFRYFHEELYKTPRSGKFFISGEGHGMTRWAESLDGGNFRGWGEGILPVSKAEALEWAEQYMDADEIEEHFPDLIQDA